MVFGSLGDALEISGEFGTMTRFHKRLTATWVALDIWIYLDQRHLKQAEVPGTTRVFSVRKGNGI